MTYLYINSLYYINQGTNTYFLYDYYGNSIVAEAVNIRKDEKMIRSFANIIRHIIEQRFKPQLQFMEDFNNIAKLIYSFGYDKFYFIVSIYCHGNNWFYILYFKCQY